MEKLTRKVTNKSNLIFSKIACLRNRWLRGHDNDYADTFGKLQRILTDLREQSGEKK